MQVTQSSKSYICCYISQEDLVKFSSTEGKSFLTYVSLMKTVLNLNLFFVIMKSGASVCVIVAKET